MKVGLINELVETLQVTEKTRFFFSVKYVRYGQIIKHHVV